MLGVSYRGPVLLSFVDSILALIDSKAKDAVAGGHQEFVYSIIQRSLIAQCHLEGENNDDSQAAALLSAAASSRVLNKEISKLRQRDLQQQAVAMVSSSRPLQTRLRE